MSFKIKNVNHIELTVRDLSISKYFYEKLPGFKLIAEYDDFLMFSVGDFKLGLTTHKRKNDIEFDEFNIGLDHIAFGVQTKKDLYEAQKYFNENKVKHGEIKLLSNNAWVIAFRDPDNIQLELAYRENE